MMPRTSLAEEAVALTSPGRVSLLSPWPAGKPIDLSDIARGERRPVLPAVTGIAWDSRAVQPGDVFIALRGGRHDGHLHIDSAIQSGAVAVVVERPTDQAVPELVVSDTRRAMSGLSALLFNHPARRLRLIGVTGTDGKTTTVHLAHALLVAAGTPAGAMSTLSFIGRNGQRSPNATDMTTPEAPALHHFMAEQERAGAAAIVIESTSHGFAQRRLDDCRFEVAAVTNLTPEHLDFHGTYERYAAAKLRVLDLLEDVGTLVTHEGDRELDRFRQAWRGHELGFGIGGGQIRADRLIDDGRCCCFTMRRGGSSARVRLPMTGRHNVLNALAAASIAVACGCELDSVAAALGRKVHLPGRLEKVGDSKPVRVLVDFAHTPAGLEAVMSALRPNTPGRLVVVFGSAGGRDGAKRPAMGRAVSGYADVVLLTADDPRDEDPAQIAEEIRRGMVGDGSAPDVRVVVDRGEAIRTAISQARAGDTVLIAGKGGQLKMYVDGGRALPWNDVAEAQAALSG